MIVYDNDKVYRNLQQQVGKNQEDIARLKSGITVSYWVATTSDLTPLFVAGNEGKYVVVGTRDSANQYLYVLTKKTDNTWIADKLGRWPDVVEGPKGDDGEDGATGPKGNSIYTCGYPLPSTSQYNEGDMVLCTVSPELGNVYKKVRGQWLLQCNIRGAQGPMGPNGTNVVANPTSPSSGAITKIKIDGKTYNVTGEGSEYTAGDGINIVDNEISVDTDTIATVDYVDESVTGLVTQDEVDDSIAEHNSSASAHATLFAGKQNTLTAGSNITISNDVISATNTTYTAGDNIDISNNVISATDTTYTAGTGISIVNNVISNTQTSAEWGNIDGDIEDQTDLMDELDDIREVAEGKCQTFVINGTDNPGFKSDVGTLTVGSFTTVDGVTHAYSDVKKGDNIYLTDTNWPDRWVSGVNSGDQRFYANKLETSKVDLTNYYTKTQADDKFLVGGCDTSGNNFSVSNGVVQVSVIGDGTGKPGLCLVNNNTGWLGNLSGGTIVGATKSYSQYNSGDNWGVICKGTLENVITGKQLTNQTDLQQGLATKITSGAISASAETIPGASTALSISIEGSNYNLGGGGSSYTAGDGIGISNDVISNLDTMSTTAPTADATDGRIHIVYLDSEPAVKYNGYIYLIAE